MALARALAPIVETPIARAAALPSLSVSGASFRREPAAVPSSKPLYIEYFSPKQS